MNPITCHGSLRSANIALDFNWFIVSTYLLSKLRKVIKIDFTYQVMLQVLSNIKNDF